MPKMKFYGVASDKDGNNYVIDNLPDTLLFAKKQAIRHCKKHKLEFQGIYSVKGTGMQNNILTKTIEGKRNRKVFF